MQEMQGFAVLWGFTKMPRADSKSSVPQGTVGSNPTLSASSRFRASRGLRGAFFIA